MKTDLTTKQSSIFIATNGNNYPQMKGKRISIELTAAQKNRSQLEKAGMREIPSSLNEKRLCSSLPAKGHASEISID
jgi:hypothetical protein